MENVLLPYARENISFSGKKKYFFKIYFQTKLNAKVVS